MAKSSQITLRGGKKIYIAHYFCWASGHLQLNNSVLHQKLEFLGLAYEAISSAIFDVKRAIPEANLVEAAPDYVGLTDVARILGCTRQNIRKLVVANDPGSPLPVYEGTPSIWRLAEILTWLIESKAYEIDDSLMEISKVNMDINTAKSWQKVESTSKEDIQTLVA